MIIFTDHSLLKLKQRGINKKQVVRTVENPDHQKSAEKDRKIVYKKIGKRYLKVILKKEDKNTIIITQYWVSKI